MKKLEEYVRSIPDFPEEGIIFRDVTSVLQDKDSLKMAIDEIQKEGIEINTFTVNDEASVKRLRDKGIDIVIGNFPDMVKRVLKGE